MADILKPEELTAAISENLELYRQHITDRINKLSETAAKRMVKLTRETAPVGKRGDFKQHIASRVVRRSPNGETRAWYVKAPDYRLTHLIVRSHGTTHGGKTKGNPFLQNAIDAVLPEYEKSVEEVIKNGD